MPSRADTLPVRILVVDDEPLIRDTLAEYLHAGRLRRRRLRLRRGGP